MKRGAWDADGMGSAQALGEFVKLRRRAAAAAAASPSAAAGSGGTMLHELPDYLLPFLLQARTRHLHPLTLACSRVSCSQAPGPAPGHLHCMEPQSRQVLSRRTGEGTCLCRCARARLAPPSKFPNILSWRR